VLTVRPHSSLGYKPPAPEVNPLAGQQTTSRNAYAELTLHRTTQWGPVTNTYTLADSKQTIDFILRKGGFAAGDDPARSAHEGRQCVDGCLTRSP